MRSKAPRERSLHDGKRLELVIDHLGNFGKHRRSRLQFHGVGAGQGR